MFMSDKIFEPFDPILFGWNTLKSNLSFFTVLMVIVAGLYYIVPLIQMIFMSDMVSTPQASMLWLAIISAFLYLIIYQVSELGLITIALEFRDGVAHNIEDFFKNYRLIPNFFIGTIIYGLMVTIGFILFVIPGIYLSLKYLFYGYLIVDKGLGPIEALKESGRMTDGAIKDLIVYLLTLWCGSAVIMMILGIFIIAPLGFISAAISKELAAGFAVIVNLILMIFNLLIIMSITKLSMADVYRILEARSADASLFDGDQEEAENMPEA